MGGGGGVVGGLDKPTSWSDLHRVRQKKSQNFKPQKLMIWPSVFYHLSVSTADQECVSLGGRISAPRHRVRAFLSHLIKDRGQVNDI